MSISAVDSEVHSVAAQEPGPLGDFNLWDKAFHILLAIMIKNPNLKKLNLINLLDNLLIYRRSVYTMMKAGGDWEKYDTKFRRAIAFLPEQVEWQRRQYDLWDDCMRCSKTVGPRKSNSIQTGAGSSRDNSKYSQGSVRYCYSFQNNKCAEEKCFFQHVCAACGSRDHGRINCSITTGVSRVSGAAPKDYKKI